MNRICAALVLAAALTLAGCLPPSTSVAVGSTKGFKPDPKLYGVWRSRGDRGNEQIMNFFKKGDTAMLLIMVNASKDKHRGEVEAYTVHMAQMGTNRFMNINMLPDDSADTDSDSVKAAAQSNMVLLYKFRKNGDLVFYEMDDKRVKAAIRAGRITGKIDPDDNSNGSHIKGDVHIIADPASTDAFMQSAAGLALFRKPIVVLEKISGR